MITMNYTDAKIQYKNGTQPCSWLVDHCPRFFGQQQGLDAKARQMQITKITERLTSKFRQTDFSLTGCGRWYV
jgi:hypothetical protein